MSRLAIDLGTTYIRVYRPGKGIVINEPSVVALDSVNNKIVAIGSEAKHMLGRTPESITAAYPLQDGVIASFRITEGMLRYFFNKITGRIRLTRPEVMVAIPAGVTSTERRAVIDACQAAGAKNTYVIKAPIAAALGAGVAISSPSGNLIIDIGGGTSEVAVIALGDVVASTSLRTAGKKIDSAIATYLRKQHGLIVGEQTAEHIKKEIGSATAPSKKNKAEKNTKTTNEKENGDDKAIEVSGSNAVTGLPESMIIKNSDVGAPIKQVLSDIILAVKQVLQSTPPELASDVMDKGIIITGGTASLKNIDKLMTKVTGVPCQVVEEPELCTVRGIGVAIEHLNEFKKSVLWMK
ncbi:MAG TPA: rod shape-determining protein [bacterium]|jgi:rod shape-determining protein MreB|nr:rod shape-determining protein [bacterium]HOR57283.1 rod shape-determining protein [bacterium]HPL56448.1 rod shape-determining protein [bacterium]HPM27847.1 rod shape-determining protein [bacterium]